VPTKEKWIFSSMKKDLDAIVLMNGVDPNLDRSFFYATGIPNGLFEHCIAILTRTRAEVISSELEETSAREAGVKTSVFKDQKHFEELVKRGLGGFRKIGINPNELTHANYKLIKRLTPKAKLVDVSKGIEDARLIKQPDEIERIRKACQIASKAGEMIPQFVSVGMTENEAAAELNYKMMMLGATAPAFETDAAFGPSSAEPHYLPMARKLKRGQLALFDFGAVHRRYVSDVTRTFSCGPPSAKQKAMYETVLEAQLAALEAMKEGVNGKEVDGAARTVIEKSDFKGRFIHSTGHGIGVSVHDPGSLSPRKDLVLKEGMILTVEPGVYIRGWGGVRIEDDALVTKSGCKILTPCTKEFRRI
jgi:Xaa-Pro dipeptidase